MLDLQECPVCSKAMCFAHSGGRCVLLINNNFGDKECPFYKTSEQIEKDKAYCEKRLASLNKTEV